MTGEIISIEAELSGQKNLTVWICFTDKVGNEIEFYRGAELLIKNGKKVWPLVCRFENFLVMTQQEILDWINANIDGQIENIIRMVNHDKLNIDVVTELQKLVGQTRSKTTAVFNNAKLSGSVAITVDEGGNIL